ncbi:hypothetical protein P11VFA_125 [Rhizobium phage P11VFA]|nr:hypothetical protein P11VFA_125 [Rhizobium phage P11VFA]
MIEVRTRARPTAAPEIAVRTRTRPEPAVQVRTRQRAVPAPRERNVDVEALIAEGNDQKHFENVLPGIRITCGICYQETGERVFLGRIVYKRMDQPCKVFVYKGKGHENDPASYVMDATKNYDDAVAVLRKRHEHRSAEKKPATQKAKAKTPPAWATGTDLSKVRKRAR